MSFVVLQPHSLSNPSDNFRVVEFRAWANNFDGIKRHLPVRAEAGSFAEAQQICDNLNQQEQIHA